MDKEMEIKRIVAAPKLEIWLNLKQMQNCGLARIEH